MYLEAKKNLQNSKVDPNIHFPRLTTFPAKSDLK